MPHRQFGQPPIRFAGSDGAKPWAQSPSYMLMEMLEARGAVVAYNDPYVPVIRPTREHGHFAGRRSIPVTDAYDLLLIAAAHEEYRSLDLSTFACPVVDTRNCVSKRPCRYYLS